MFQLLTLAVSTGGTDLARKSKKLHLRRGFYFLAISYSGGTVGQHRTTLGLSIPLVALRVSTTSLASPTIFL